MSVGQIDVGLLLNRDAVRKHFGFLAQSLSAWAAENGLRYDAHVTNGAHDLTPVVEEMLSRGAKQIIVAGGDGTVARAASALLTKDVPLGILPLGTANGVARQLGIPLQAEGALDLLTGENQLRSLDGIKVDDRVFLISLSVGLSVKALDELGPDGKERFGVLSYYLNALKKVFGIDSHKIRLTFDQRELHGQFLEVAVLNMQITGLPAGLMGGEIRPDDGWLRALAVRRGRPANSPALFRSNETETADSWVHLSEVRTVEIHGSSKIRVQADGDVIGQLPVQAEIVPKAIRVIVPAAA